MAANPTFKTAALPKAVERQLSSVRWEKPDVLVGALRNRHQLEVCLHNSFYHMPAISIDPAQVRYIAIYQSQSLFGGGSGIRYYGAVTGFSRLPRRQIPEIPKDSDEPYYRFDIRRWRRLSRPIRCLEVPLVHLLTNSFLLKNSRETPALLLRSEAEFRLWHPLTKAVRRHRRFPKGRTGFRFGDMTFTLCDGSIQVRRGSTPLASCSAEDFALSPAATFRLLCSQIF